jgi:hypothetical protein
MASEDLIISVTLIESAEVGLRVAVHLVLPFCSPMLP